MGGNFIARYLKIDNLKHPNYIRGQSDPESVANREIQLLDSSNNNISLGTNVTVSARTSQSKYPSANAVDGNINTFWADKGNGTFITEQSNGWFLLDLKQEFEISSVWAASRSQYAQLVEKCDIYYSLDGVQYELLTLYQGPIGTPSYYDILNRIY